MNLFKKCFLKITLFTLLFAGLFSNHALAQTSSIYASDIKISQDVLLSGGEISGTFNLYNISTDIISGVRYRVELMKIFEDTFNFENEEGKIIDSVKHDEITESFFVSSLSEPIIMPSGVSEMPFGFRLPAVIPEGRIGLLVQLYTSDNLKSGYEYIEIDIQGDKAVYFPTRGQVSVTEKTQNNKEVFEALEGPYITKNDVATFDVYIQNPTKENIVLSPVLRIFKGNDINGENVHTKNLNVANVAVGETKLSYEVFSDLEPGVYTAVIDYVDNAKNSRTNSVEFRYIIDGIKPKIKDVLYSTLDMTIEESFSVFVSYAATPLNFRKSIDGSYMDSRVEKFVNENEVLDLDMVSEELGQVDIQTDFLAKGMTSVVRVTDAKNGKLLSEKNIEFIDNSEEYVSFDSFTDVQEIKVDVELYQEGELVDTYTEQFYVTTNTSTDIVQKIWSEYKLLIAISILLLIIGIILTATKISKRNKGYFGAVSIALIIFGSSLVFIDNVEARGGNSRVVKPKHLTHDDWVSCGRPSVRGGGGKTSDYANCGSDRRESGMLAAVAISSPKPPAVKEYVPGENIGFKGDFAFTYCTNSGYSLRLRTTKPVLVGSAHTGFSAWQNLKKGTWLGSNGAYAKEHPKYSSYINMPLIAPNKSGDYKFKYQLAVNSGGWYDIKEGELRFRVAKDACSNIDDFQKTVPPNNVQTVTVTGNFVCNVPDPLVSNLTCFASRDRLAIGENVTYRANISNGSLAAFSWFNNSNASGATAKTENNTSVSSYVTSYNRAGVFPVSVKANLASGEIKTCNVEVTVYDGPREGEETTEDEFEYVEPTEYVDENGIRYPFVPGAPDGKINFNMDEGLTNSKCASDWSTENMLVCRLFNNNVRVKDIPFIGNEELSPGTYQVRCIQAKDGSVVVSETRVCTMNPDVRER